MRLRRRRRHIDGVAGVCFGRRSIHEVGERRLLTVVTGLRRRRRGLPGRPRLRVFEDHSRERDGDRRADREQDEQEADERPEVLLRAVPLQSLQHLRDAGAGRLTHLLQQHVPEKHSA